MSVSIIEALQNAEINIENVKRSVRPDAAGGNDGQ